MTYEEQENLIRIARKNKEESLEILADIPIYYEADRHDYKYIINAATERDAINKYNWMDTAAREEFITIIKSAYGI